MLLLLMVGINLLLYVKNQQSTIQLTWKSTYDEEGNEIIPDSDITIDMLYRLYPSYVATFQEHGIQSLDDFYTDPFYDLKEELCGRDGDEAVWLCNYLMEQYAKREQFDTVIADIVQQASSENTVSIFRKDNGGQTKNQQRTLRDYTRLQEQQITWEIGPTYAFSSVMAAREPIYLLLIFVIVVVWQMGEEQKKGLREVIYPASGGRGRITIKRILILLCSSVLSVAALYGSLLAFTVCRYGGIQTLSQPVQCLESYYRLPYIQTVGQAFCMQMLFTAGGLLVLSLLIWLLILITGKRTMAVVGSAVILAVQWLLYKTIKPRSTWALLYYLNMFQLIFPSGWLRQYINWENGPVLLNQYTMSAVFLAAGVLLLGLFVILCGTFLHPVRGKNRVQKALDKAGELLNRIPEWMNAYGKEFHKLFMHQYLWVLLLMTVWVSHEEYKISGLTYSDIDWKYEKQFYENYTGPVDEALFDYVEELETGIADLNAQLQEAEAQGGDTQQIKGSIQTQENRLYNLTTRIDELQKLYDEQGINGWIMDENGYSTMLGYRNESSQLALGMVSVLAVLLAGAVIFSQEEQCGTSALLNSQAGRNRLIVRKYMVLAAYTLLVWCASYGVNLINMVKVYHLHDFSAPAQSVHALKDFPLRISLGGFLAWLYGLRFLCMYAAGCMGAFFSRRLGYYSSILVSMLVMLPHILVLFGVNKLEYLSIVYSVSFLQIWTSCGNTWRLWSRYGLLFVLCLISFIPAGGGRIDVGRISPKEWMIRKGR
jgi:hypothetical protein